MHLDILMQNTVLLINLLSASVSADFSLKNLSPIFLPLYLIYLVPLTIPHNHCHFSSVSFPIFFVCVRTDVSMCMCIHIFITATHLAFNPQGVVYSVLSETCFLYFTV